jgi:hypothetical protein
MPTCLSQSERLAYMMDRRIKYISRTNVRDSSEYTAIQKARGSSVELPGTAQSVVLASGPNGIPFGISTIITIRGNGTNMDYDSHINFLQGCAICSDVNRTDNPAVNAGVNVPITCPDFNNPPLAQQIMSNAYTVPCQPSGTEVYFPPFVQRGDISNGTCSYEHLPFPSG